MVLRYDSPPVNNGVVNLITGSGRLTACSCSHCGTSCSHSHSRAGDTLSLGWWGIVGSCCRYPHSVRTSSTFADNTPIHSPRIMRRAAAATMAAHRCPACLHGIPQEYYSSPPTVPQEYYSSPPLYPKSTTLRLPLYPKNSTIRLLYSLWERERGVGRQQ